MGRRKKKAAEAEGTEKKSKSQLVPAAVLAVGLLGGAFLMRPGDAAPAAAAPAPTETAEEAHAEGPVVLVPPVTVNLTDDHYLRVAFALQLAAHDEAEAGGGGGHGGGGEEAPAMSEGELAKALDIAITFLGHHSRDQLADPAQRATIKDELTAQIAEAYHGKVEGLYFTEFVMQ